MNVHTADELQEILRPIASLISKSEKAQQKLTPGTWQRTMLRDNLKALHIAFSLLSKDISDMHNFTRGDFPEALQALTSMISKVEKAQTKFLPGTSHYTLQKNRLKALRVASFVIAKSLNSA